MSKLSITSLLRKALVSDNEVSRLVAGRIFPLVAPKGTDGDAIVYARESYSQSSDKMGAWDECTVVYNVASTDYDRSQQIAEALHSVLMRTEIPSNPLGHAELVESREEFDLDGLYYVQILIYRV